MHTALVTGASTGIGKTVALKIAKLGYQVFLVARSKDGLEKTAQIISQNGGSATMIPTDLSQLDLINNLIDQVKKSIKSLDALINIAGVWHGQDSVYADIDYQEFDQQVIMDTYMVGAIAPALLCHGLIPLMSINSKIINLSGTFENGAKGWLPYFVSKRAIEDLTIGLAEELADKKIQVNCISPSDTATEAYAKFFPQYMDEAVEPKKIADWIEYLCSRDDITGKVFVIKKGQDPFEGYHQ